MPPERVVSAPDFSSAFLKLDIMGALQLALLPAIVSILFTDLFDSLSTFIGVASASGLTEPDGRPLNLKRGLIVDAFATLGAGLAGTSSGTAYVESIAGIRMGARTGRASVVTALCFLPCLFVGPLAAAVPGYATAAVLVLVGLSMFQSVTTLELRVDRRQPAGVRDHRPHSADAVDHAGHPVGLPSPRAALRRRRAGARGAADHVGPRRAVSGTAADCKVRLKADRLRHGTGPEADPTSGFPARQSPRLTASGLSRRNEPKTSPVTPGIADSTGLILARGLAPLPRHEQLARAACERRGAYVVGQLLRQVDGSPVPSR